MTRRFQIHPVNPQPRLISQCAAALRGGALVAYPTDSSYALGCCIGDKLGTERMRRLRGLEAGHELSLVCRDLSELAIYGRVDNPAYRLLRSLTPGPYTFVLRATREVPRRLQDPKRRTVGVRVPGHPVAQALLEALGEPLMSTTLELPGDDLPLNDPLEIAERLDGQVDLVMDAGPCGIEPTTVVDLTGDRPVVLRRGLGPTGVFE